MRRCGARPYKGSEKYIFISYSHKDISRVFPIIERLTRDGYRVWYDEGIDPGAEWADEIAEHLLDCEVCLPLISENYLESENCRQEIAFAKARKKNVVTVMLEEVTLPIGLEMQLGVIQKVYKYTQTEEEFFYKLYDGKKLKPCLGKPNPEIHVSVPEDYEEEKPQNFPEKPAENMDDSQKNAVGDVNRTADPVKEKPGRVNQETDSAGIKPGNVNQETDSVGIKPGNVNQETDSVGIKPGNVNQETDSAGIKPGKANQETDSAGIKPGNVNQETDSVGIKPENVNQETDSAGIKPGRVNQETDSAGIKPEKANRKTDLTGKKSHKRAVSVSDDRKEPVTGWRKYLPPGYRTGKIWHMIIATCYYATIIVALVMSTGTSLLDDIVVWVYCIILFFGSAAIWGNYLGCWEKIPFMKNKVGRLLGFVIYPLLLLVVMSALLLIIYSAAGIS